MFKRMKEFLAMYLTIMMKISFHLIVAFQESFL